MKSSIANSRLPQALGSTRALGWLALLLLPAALTVFPRLSQAADDTSHGKELFEKRCTGCHSLDQDKEGPRLRGIYGRKSASVASFNYSPAMRGAHIVWDDASLEKWLTDPDSVVPDTDMDFRVPKADERAEIIRFLKASSGK